MREVDAGTDVGVVADGGARPLPASLSAFMPSTASHAAGPRVESVVGNN